jgi:hypothetical protein
MATVVAMPTFHASTGSFVAIHHGPQHAEHHREDGGRIDAERHGGDVGAAGALHEAQCEPRVHEISREHAEGRAGDHLAEHELGREAEDADERSARMTRTPTLSRASPRNPFRSPGPNQAGLLRRPGDGTAEIPHGLARAVRELATPLELAATVRDGAVVELDDVGHLIAEPDARAVALAFALVAALDLVLALNCSRLACEVKKLCNHRAPSS